MDNSRSASSLSKMNSWPEEEDGSSGENIHDIARNILTIFSLDWDVDDGGGGGGGRWEGLGWLG